MPTRNNDTWLGAYKIPWDDPNFSRRMLAEHLSQEVAQLFERNTPGIASRLDAIRQCVQAGYPVRAVLMPIVPVDD